MPTTYDEALHKVTLNLFADDVIAMERIHGRGWSGVIRDMVREHVKEREHRRQQQGGQM